MPQSPPDERVIALPLLKLAIFTLVAPASVTVWLPFCLLFPEIRHRPVEAYFFTADVLFPIGPGAAGYLWCGLEFAFAGKGTPAPIDPPKVLLVRGLYRRVRNPISIGVLLILLGESLFFRSAGLLSYAAAIVTGFNLFVVWYEEPALRKSTGQAYAPYLKGVPRWIPSLGGTGPGNAL